MIMDIQAILREFDPIRRQIAQPEGVDSIVLAAVPVPGELPSDPVLADQFSITFFCTAAEQMLAAGHGYPDAAKYSWIADPQYYNNSFEVWCQSFVVNLLIGLWEQRSYRCEKLIIARNIHTGSYHIETYETESAYFVCVSYQYFNLINCYALLNYYLIEAGGKARRLRPITATDEVAGQTIELSLRLRWSEIVQHLDTFLLIAAKASDYAASEVYLKQHIATATEQFYTSERYAHLCDAARLMAGPFYVPAEVMWTQYSDNTMIFSLAHELTHILEGDLKKRGRAMTEEMGADLGAVSLLISITVSTAQREGYKPSIGGSTLGPIVFFALSRVFAYLDDFEMKYWSGEVSETSTQESMQEEMALMQRSLSVAGFLAGSGWITEPSAAVFWNITGELKLIEIALRRRLWEVGGTPTPLMIPLETEIAMEQETIQKAKKRTENDVRTFWERMNKTQS